MDRKHARFRLNGRRIRRRGDRKVDVAGAELLQYLGLLAKLCPWELVDDQCSVAQLWELVGEGVGGNAVCRRMRLVVSKAEVAGIGGPSASRHRHDEAQ